MKKINLSAVAFACICTAIIIMSKYGILQESKEHIVANSGAIVSNRITHDSISKHLPVKK